MQVSLKITNSDKYQEKARGYNDQNVETITTTKMRTIVPVNKNSSPQKFWQKQIHLVLTIVTQRKMKFSANFSQWYKIYGIRLYPNIKNYRSYLSNFLVRLHSENILQKKTFLVHI